jgi:hypothetical protein
MLQHHTEVEDVEGVELVGGVERKPLKKNKKKYL